MAARYWVGGALTANWSENTAGVTNWATTSGGLGIAAVPVSSDDVFMDGVGTGASNSTISASINVRSVNCTGYGNTLTQNSLTTLSIGDGTAGASNIALKFSTGMTYSIGGATTIIKFTSTSTTVQSVDSGGLNMPNTTYDGVLGSWQLTTHTFTQAVTSYLLTLTNGSYDANSLDHQVGILSSNNANTRVLNVGTGNTWTITGNNATIINFSTTTGLTFSGTATFNCNYAGSTGTRTLNPTTAVTLGNIKISSGTDTVSISASIGALNFSGFAGTLGTGAFTMSGALLFYGGMTITSTSNAITLTATASVNITSNSVPCNRTLTFNGVGGTFVFKDSFTQDGATVRTATLTAGTLDWSDSGANHTLTFMNFSSSNSNARGLTVGGTFTCTGNAGTIWTTSTDTNLTITGTLVVLCSYSGATGTRTVACAATESKAASFSVTAGTDSFASNTAARSLDFTGFTGTWTNTAFNLYGNLTLTSGMTVTAGTNAMTLAATSGTQTITSNTKAMDRPVTQNGIGGTTAIADAFAIGATRTLTITNGTFTNGTGALVISSGLISIGASGTLTLGTATHLLTGVGTVWSNSGTVNGLATCILKITSTSSSAITFAGGGASFAQVWFSRGSGTGTHTITGSNTFTVLKDDGTGTHSLLFTAGTTTTLPSASAWQVSGTSGHLITVGSDTSSAHSIICASGSVIADYLSLSYSQATGGANFYAGSHSTDGGNNLGWNFSDHGTPSNSAFFLSNAVK